MRSKLILVGAVALLASCGTNPEERTSGGAAAGAATGAGIGALAGPPGAVVGALVGAGAGAATGAATSPKEVNLGKPPWTNPEARVPVPGGQRSGSRMNAAVEHRTVEQLNDQSLQSARQAPR
jgi:phage tail tape-measure protein